MSDPRIGHRRDKRAKAPAEVQDQRQAMTYSTCLHPLAGIRSPDYLLLDNDKLNSLPGAQAALTSRWDWRSLPTGRPFVIVLAP